ncbi:MAG: hypothetical protein ACRDLB_10125 [Actinomycetota bacterium]
MDEIDIEAKELAQILSLGRVVLGVGAVLAPRRFGRMWTGEHSETAVSAIAVRGMGARDIALGLGTLRALDGEGPARPWLEAQALADASDTVSTLGSFGKLPPLRRLIGLATAAGACYVGLRLASELE